MSTSFALTKGFEVMLMTPASDGGPYFSIWGSQNLGQLEWEIGTLATYSYRPMQLIQNGNRVRGILDNTVVQHVYGQFGIVNQWLSFGADIPIGWWADFRDPNVTTATNQNKFVMGDINLNFKSELVRTKYFGLALLPFITIPTGYGKEFFGNGNVTGGGSVIAEVKPLSIWSVSLNAGIQGREKFIFRDIEKSNQLLLGLGTAVQIIDPVSLAAEIVSSTRLSGPFSEEKESPVEARAGVKWMIGKSGFLASLGGGAGIVRGSGAPSYRAFAGLSFSPRRMEKEKMQEVVQSNFISIKDCIVYFDSDSTELNDDSGSKLAELSYRIRDAKTHIQIKGYVDTTGKELSNKLLSKNRAEKVAWFLNLMGIDFSRMEVIGKGEIDPIGDNKTSEGRAKNRRVEINSIQ